MLSSVRLRVDFDGLSKQQRRKRCAGAESDDEVTRLHREAGWQQRALVRERCEVRFPTGLGRETVMFGGCTSLLFRPGNLTQDRQHGLQI